MNQELENLLKRCTVKIVATDSSGWGTGFFVAPGLILTCAHVVKGVVDRPVSVLYAEQSYLVTLESTADGDRADLVLLRLQEPVTEQACVYLDESVQLNDPLCSYGYPDDFPEGAFTTFQSEALTGSDSFIKFKAGQVRPGMSGSPLLNLRIGKVCGIVKFTRDRSIDLGGGAVPTRVILEQFPQLRELQQQFHQQNLVWNQLLVESPTKSQEKIREELKPFMGSRTQDLTLPDPLPPSFLLRAEYGVVPFTGREDALKHMLNWCKSPLPFSMHILHGQAGMGKTRLMREVCLRLEMEGWITGFFQPKIDGGAIDEAIFKQMTELPFPFLLVIDYTEAQYRNVEIFLKLVKERNSQIQLRLVLIARQLGEWSEQIRINYIDRGVFPTSFILQTELVDIESRSIRKQIYLAALGKFHLFLNPNPPPSNGIDSSKMQQDFSKNTFGRPLIIQLAALVEVLGYQETELDNLLIHLFNHEEWYWQKLLQEQHPNAPKAMRRALKPLVVINTLLGGQTRQQLRALAEQMSTIFDLVRSELRDILEILAECYGKEAGLLDPLQPDLIGEWLISRELNDKPELLQNLVTCLNDHQVKVVFDTLNRTADHFSDAGKWLREGLELNPAQLTPIMLTVASETGGEAAKALTIFLKNDSLDRDTIKKLEKALPKYTVDLREARVLIVEQCLSFLMENDDVSERARLLSKLSAYLLGLNRLEYAQEKAREAATYYRIIVQNDPHNPSHLASLAFSLNIYAGALVGAARSQEAESPAREALALYEVLVSSGDKTINSRLASSQHTLAAILGEAGDFSEALDLIESAIEIYENGCGQEGHAYTVELASCFADKALLLAAVGRRNLAAETAMRATRLFRKFIDDRQGQCHFELAVSLTGLANRYHELGWSEKARDISKEAEGIWRSLAEGQPESFKRYLAKTLLNQAIILRATTNQYTADQPAQEAVELYKEIFEAGSKNSVDELVMALGNLGDILHEQKKFAEAKEVLYRALALDLDAQIISNGQISSPFLANSAAVRHNLSLTLRSLEDYDGALEFAADALRRLIPRFEGHPTTYHEWMRKLILNYKTVCERADLLPAEEFRAYLDI